VDDDPILLKFVTSLLVRDYDVLRAGSGQEALQLSRNYKPVIHLLLTDFEMPEMNGIALATQISLERPQIKVLLMSGFTGGMLVLNEGWHFLPKPFIPSQLRALISGLINSDESGKAQRAGSENFV
jgi:two-component system cell cycle sensor histidine kinase/response regulator CckA